MSLYNMIGNKGYRKGLLIILTLAYLPNLWANTPIIQPNLSTKTKIAPAYFGPNAFQVPDMLDGRTSANMELSLSADYYSGTLTTWGGDITAGLSAKCIIPLFSSRANLVLWMPVLEYYHTNREVNEIRRIPNAEELDGWDSGDVYVSTDIQMFTQELHGVDIALRAAMKTASGNTYSKARYYDAPGYFFDVAIGRDFATYTNNLLRIAASGGFLCWQTDIGRQNDAVMYGIQASWTHNRLTFNTTFGGYAGWEHDGDCPMIIKTMLSYQFEHLSVNAFYKAGIMDWPFHQMNIGITYRY